MFIVAWPFPICWNPGKAENITEADRVVYSDEQLMQSVEVVLEAMDANDDGFISYREYIEGQDKFGED